MASRIITLFLSFLFSHLLIAQELVCGTKPPTLQQRQIMEETLAMQKLQGARALATSQEEFAIVAHIVRNSDGTGGISEAELQAALDNVNDFYANANMYFFFLDIRYIDNSQYYDYFTGDEGEMTAEHNVEGVMNIYFVNSATNGEFGLCGYAYFPGGPDVILMVNSCTTNGSTFPHEIGHFFSLYHTHGTTNTGTTDELVIRPGEESTACVAPDCTPLPANCEDAGDQLCDTPADPNVSGQIDGSCQYVPNGNRPTEDANGDTFIPDGTNIMSYSTKACRNIFSAGQYDRMAATAASSRQYLHKKTLLAQFSADDNEVCLGESVSFIDQSINAVAYDWTFEGGNPASSSDPSPVVSYETPGSFAVTLVTTDANGNTDEKVFQQFVTVRDEVTSTAVATSGSFEEATILENVIDYDGEPWELSGTGSEGIQSVFIRLYRTVNGSEDYLVLDPINTETAKTFFLSFDYAYVALSDANTDRLEVVYRDPCGDWVSVWSKEGVDLQTAANDNQFVFFPSSSEEWRSESTVIELPSEIAVAEIAFRVTSDNGNTIHLDNYQLVKAFEISETQVVRPTCSDLADGSFTVITSGEESLEYRLGDGPFTASNEFTDLAAGIYEVTIRNSAGFELIETVTLVAENEYPAEPVIEFSQGQLSIGSATAESIEWYLNDEMIDNSGAVAIDSAGLGIYTAVLSNGSCSSESQPFEIFDVSIVDIINTSCSDAADGSFRVETTASESTELAFGIGSYGSQTTFSNLIAGEYTISVRGESGYEMVRNVVVGSENEYPEKPQITFENGTLRVSTTGSETIAWYLNEQVIDGATTEEVEVSGSGAYTVSLSNGGCASMSDPFIVLSSTLVEESLTLFPNPASDYITLKVSNQVDTRQLRMSLSDLTGRVVYQGEFVENMDVQDLKGGLYLVQIQIEGQMISRRFMKK